MNENYVYLTRRNIAESPKYPFTLNAISLHIFKAKKNGLDKAIFRIGKKILIREDLFIEWLESRK